MKSLDNLVKAMSKHYKISNAATWAVVAACGMGGGYLGGNGLDNPSWHGLAMGTIFGLSTGIVFYGGLIYYKGNKVEKEKSDYTKNKNPI